MKKLPPRAENLRRALAQEAARIMSEHGIRDFLTAKRKAAERFGVTDGSVLPKNREIEDALAEYHRLFGGTKHGETLAGQRNAALSAMQMLADFEPRLVGSVLAARRADAPTPACEAAVPEAVVAETVAPGPQSIRTSPRGVSNTAATTPVSPSAGVSQSTSMPSKG